MGGKDIEYHIRRYRLVPRLLLVFAFTIFTFSLTQVLSAGVTTEGVALVSGVGATVVTPVLGFYQKLTGGDCDD